MVSELIVETFDATYLLYSTVKLYSSSRHNDTRPFSLREIRERIVSFRDGQSTAGLKARRAVLLALASAPRDPRKVARSRATVGVGERSRHAHL